jgi:hypothetical protein
MPHRSYGLDLFLLSIDEGIAGYRDDSLETVKRNEATYGIPLKVCSVCAAPAPSLGARARVCVYHACVSMRASLEAVQRSGQPTCGGPLKVWCVWVCLVPVTWSCMAALLCGTPACVCRSLRACPHTAAAFTPTGAVLP